MKGISAVIPTYKGEKYISKLLDCLKNQTLDNDLFEAIFIINGELDSTPNIIEDFKENNPDIDIKVEYSEKGVCNARNLGIEKVSKEYTIFIDDDDFISEKYFEVLLKYAKKDRIVIGTFLDIDEDTKEVKPSYLSPPLLEKSGIVENPYTNEYQGILTITTDKLIPTEYVKKSRFNPELKNGVDIGYYSTFYALYDFEFYTVDKSEDAVYYRLWRDDSISRKALSYDFNITDRLKVINDINKGLKLAGTPEKISFIKSMTSGQVVKINEYLAEYPQDLSRVLKDIASFNFEFFPYKYLYETEVLDRKNNELIISYAFAPTNTTTSNMVAKRIFTEKNNVDVIYATLNSLNKDYELEKLVDQFLIRKFEVELDFEDSWSNIKEFTEKGMDKLKGLNYEKIYSRAYFPHSHFLALEYKLTHPDTYWRAEFSDPLIYSMNKQENTPPINDQEFTDYINNRLGTKYTHIKKEDSVNLICEYLTYIFADEVIFTNENQAEVMKEIMPYPVAIDEKTTINPHPTLDEKYYYIKDSSYETDDNYINFAYFGVIFGNRTLEDFIEGFDNLDNELKDKIRFHVFTPNKILFEQVLSSELYNKTTINPVVNFLDFLNIATKFDVLLVEDSQIKGVYSKNPFLPSKISDYKGSKRDIWAICDDTSIMNHMDIKYKSRLKDMNSATTTLNRIINDKANLNNEVKLKDNEEYLRNRIKELTVKISELVQVAEEEFRKDEEFINEINRLKEELERVQNENNEMKNSNSWKLTGSFRSLRQKFK